MAQTAVCSDHYLLCSYSILALAGAIRTQLQLVLLRSLLARALHFFPLSRWVQWKRVGTYDTYALKKGIGRDVLPCVVTSGSLHNARCIT